MPGVGLAPGGAMAAENLRNLKRGTSHGPRRSGLGLVLLLDQAEPVQGAHHFADRGGGHPGIERRRVELRVAKQNLDDADIDILLQKMGRKTLLSVCSETRLPISATWAAAWQMRFNWRVVSGLTGFCPGNSQATGLPMRHHSRRISSSMGESMAWRSLRPLPCSTRNTVRTPSCQRPSATRLQDLLSPAPWRRSAQPWAWRRTRTRATGRPPPGSAPWAVSAGLAP